MNERKSSVENNSQIGLTRRGFVATGAALGLATVVSPAAVLGAEANSKITLGLVGSGHRGQWIADLFNQHGGYQFVAAADYFQDRAEEAGKRLNLPAAKCFTGLSGYKRVLDVKPDAIVIESPPYFHPEHAMAGVEAGCHVYCAKPIAVDVPGCLTMAEAGRKGTEKKRCVLIDFQTRSNEFFKESVRRVHAGDIGPVVSGEAVFHTSGGGSGDLSTPENRLRHWSADNVLSGDVITEQSIHAIDVATWFADRAPLSAVGACTKVSPSKNRECHDYFSVIYTFPNNLTVTFAAKQYGTGFREVACWMFGAKGTADTHYGGLVRIVGEKSYKGGRADGIFTEGVVANIANFHAAATKGDCANTSVPASVRSNLTTILGRMAAYRKGEATWTEMMKTAEKLEFPTAKLKS